MLLLNFITFFLTTERSEVFGKIQILVKLRGLGTTLNSIKAFFMKWIYIRGILKRKEVDWKVRKKEVCRNSTLYHGEIMMNKSPWTKVLTAPDSTQTNRFILLKNYLKKEKKYYWQKNKKTKKDFSSDYYFSIQFNIYRNILIIFLSNFYLWSKWRQHKKKK